MKKYSVKLKSLTPYMQHRMDDLSLEEWEKNRKQLIERPELSQPDYKRAEFHCYRNSKGLCYIPSEQIRQSLISAGTYMKSKVGASSKSMTYIVAATFMIPQEELIVPNYDLIDKRTATNKIVKARIIVIRPKWSKWELNLVLEVREDSITLETIKQLFAYAGTYVGIGSYRPANKGLFGQYELVDITPIN